MQMSQVPFVLDQLRGQPVEQFGVCGQVALQAEVVRRLDNAPAEVPLPDAVGNDACGQRVIGADHPLGQSPSTPRRLTVRRDVDHWNGVGQHAREPRLDEIARSMGIAASQHMRRRRVFPILFDDQGEPLTAWGIVAQLSELLALAGVGVEVDLRQELADMLSQHVFANALLLKVVDFTSLEVRDHLLFKGRDHLFLSGDLLSVSLQLLRMSGQLFRRRDVTDGVFLDGLLRALSEVLHIPEERQKAVIVGVRNRVEFMIVAPCTIHCESEKRLGCRAHDVVQAIEVCHLPVDRFIVPQPQTIIPGCDQRIGSHLIELISRQLFHQEPIEGLVLIDRANHIVTVSPDKGFGIVALVAVGLCVSNQIEPVTGPVLAVLG